MPGIERDGEELPRLSPGVGCDSTAQGECDDFSPLTLTSTLTLTLKLKSGGLKCVHHPLYMEWL